MEKKRTLPEVLARAASWLDEAFRTSDHHALLDVLARNGRAADMIGSDPVNFVACLDLPRERICVPAPDLRARIQVAETRLMAPLPPTLVELWATLDRSQAAARLLDAVVLPKIYRPEQLTSPPEWAADAKLACAVQRDIDSVCDSREYFGTWTADRERTYQDLFDEADPKWKTDPGRHWSTWPKDTGLLLPPDVADGLILVGGGDGEMHVAVTSFRENSGDCPVFAIGWDFEGFAFRKGNDCIEWIEEELDRVIARVAQECGRL